MRTFVIILVLVLILGGSYFLLKTQPTPTNPVTASTQTTSTDSGIVAMYSREQVATHNNSTDCWTIIGSSIYNLTSWITEHPGGERAIISLCGKDGTTAFESQHGGQGKPEKILSTFFIGTLKIGN